MNIVKVLADKSTNRIPIGKQGENKATAVQFFVKTWLEMWTGATVALAVQPPTGNAYPAIVTTQDNITTWVITAADTAVPGIGKCELRVLLNDVVKKSDTFQTYIAESFTADGEAPDPVTDWIEDAQAKLGEVDDAVDLIENMTVSASASETPSAELSTVNGHYHIAFGLVKGDKGDQGVQGPAGADGAPGQDGAPGADGKDGADGAPGKDGKDGADGAPGQDGAPGADGTTFTPSVAQNGDISWTNDGGKTNPQTVNIKGPAGPGLPLGGTQGQIVVKKSGTDYDTEWSDDLSNLKSAVAALEPAATSGDVGKFLKAKTVANGKVTAYEFGEGGGGTVVIDQTLSHSGEAADAKATGDAINALKIVTNNLAQWLYAEDQYLNSNFELTNLVGYNTYKIPCTHIDFLYLSCSSNMFGTLGDSYRYALETATGFSRSLTASNYVVKGDNKSVIFIAPANTVALYLTFKADVVSGITAAKNTIREYAPANDIANGFIIPVDDTTAVDPRYYLRVISGTNTIYSYTNESYHTWWIKVKAGDTMKFKASVSGLSFNAVYIDTSDTITQITTLSKTFSGDATVCVFEHVDHAGNTKIIPAGAKYQVDYSNITDSPFENTFSGLQGVAFGTSLTYRAQTTGGYLNYLPVLSGIIFDNQGIGSSRIYGESGSLDMLAAIKAYNAYSGKKVCLLEGFVNDWYYASTLGTWKDTTETSVCGCIRSALNYMISQNANMTVFLILDPYGRNYNSVDCSSTALNGSNLTQYEFYEEIAKVAESLGIPVIREYAESQISENTPQYLSDNIHPNALGARQSANFIWSKMKQYYANAVT